MRGLFGPKVGQKRMVATDPCSIGLLVPVDEDARDYVVDELEPLFAATPALRGLIVLRPARPAATLSPARASDGARR